MTERSDGGIATLLQSLRGNPRAGAQKTSTAVALRERNDGWATRPPGEYGTVLGQIFTFIAKGVVVQFTLEVPDGPLTNSPQGGDSSRSNTIAQSIKDGQFFEPRQWLMAGSSWPHSTKFFQFFRYWRSFLTWGDAAVGSS